MGRRPASPKVPPERHGRTRPITSAPCTWPAGGSPRIGREIPRERMTSSARTPQPMESSPAWLGLNEGYRNSWPASQIFRYKSPIRSQPAIKLLRASIGAVLMPVHMEGIAAAGQPVAATDFATWRSEGGKVAEMSTIQDQFAKADRIPSRRGLLRCGHASGPGLAGGRNVARTCAGSRILVPDALAAPFGPASAGRLGNGHGQRQ